MNQTETSYIKSENGNIYLNTWERGAISYRTSTLSGAQNDTGHQIHRGKNGEAVSTMPNIALGILFHGIMLRDPGSGEHDFIFTREDFLELANRTWQAMDTM